MANMFSPLLNMLKKTDPSIPANGGPRVEFWVSPDRAGWLMKQGEHIKTWRAPHPPRPQRLLGVLGIFARTTWSLLLLQASPLVCAEAGQDILVQERAARPQLRATWLHRRACARSSMPNALHVFFSGPAGMRHRQTPCALPSQVSKCLSVKGAEDSLNKQYAFEARPLSAFAARSTGLLRRAAPRRAPSREHFPCRRAQVSTNVETMYFVADNDKDKEDWINSIGRAIVRHSASLQENEVMNY